METLQLWTDFSGGKGNSASIKAGKVKPDGQVPEYVDSPKTHGVIVMIHEAASG